MTFKFQRVLGLATLSLLLVGMIQNAGAQDTSSSKFASPLPGDAVIDNLIRKNEERTKNLLHYEATRVYHLAYHGFPNDREAEMTVEASYDRPSTKRFSIVEQSGSKIILDRVFRKLLESESEAAQPEMNSRTQLNRENYNFELVNYDNSTNEYVLSVTPKANSKYVYRGKVWVDGTDFAVTHIEAEPAQNPSFWTKKSEILQRYVKVDNFWLPARNESTSYIRLGGRAVLTIEYKDYRLTGASKEPSLLSRSELQTNR
jgi:outer membrane lipoprotein-sorting protein